MASAKLLPQAAPALPEWVTKQLPNNVERYTVDVGDGLRMHVQNVGKRNSDKCVLMIHGNPTWSFLYRKVITQLQEMPQVLKDARLVAPDLMGMGFSSAIPASGHTIENHGRWMRALVDNLRAEGVKHFVLVVQDWGGPVGLRAFQLPAQYDTLGGMVVLNTAVGPPRAGFRPTLFHRVARWPIVSWFLFTFLGLPQRFMYLAQGDRSSISPEASRAYLLPFSADPEKAGSVLALARMVPNGPQHFSIPTLKETEEVFLGHVGKQQRAVPTTIVWGDRDPVLGRLRTHLARLRPDATVIATNGGHFIQEEKFVEIADAVVSALSKL